MRSAAHANDPASGFAGRSGRGSTCRWSGCQRFDRCSTTTGDAMPCPSPVFWAWSRTGGSIVGSGGAQMLRTVLSAKSHDSGRHRGHRTFAATSRRTSGVRREERQHPAERHDFGGHPDRHLFVLVAVLVSECSAYVSLLCAARRPDPQGIECVRPPAPGGQRPVPGVGERIAALVGQAVGQPRRTATSIALDRVHHQQARRPVEGVSLPDVVRSRVGPELSVAGIRNGCQYPLSR